MSRRRIGLIFIMATIILAGTYFSGAAELLETIRPRRVNAATIEATKLAVLPPAEEAIALFQERADHEPEDAVSLTLLGQQYARLAWENEDVDLIARSEETLRRSLALLPGYTPAEAALAAAQLARHDFDGALQLAQAVYETDPRRTDALATAGDAALGLGRYEEAISLYEQLHDAAPSPQSLARLAHLAELQGRPDEAINQMQRATAGALDEGQSRQQFAWYLFRLGDLYFDGGRLDEAEGYLEAALELRPGYAAALGVLGEVSAALGDYDEAISFHERALAASKSIGTLAALGDLHALSGRPEEAWNYYQAIETTFAPLAESEPEIYGRELAAYYADHDMKLDEARALIEADLERRADMHGYDAAAWIYCRLGELELAQELMEQALRLGTRDAALLYHAGMISKGLGETAEAANLLSEALTINPAFDPIQAQIAERALADIS